MLTFNNTIEIIVPKKDNDGKELDFSLFYSHLVRQFGGYTLFENGISGAWFSQEDKKTYIDQHSILRLDVSGELTAHQKNNLFGFVSELFVSQYAVYVSINGKTTIIEKEQTNELINFFENVCNN